MNSPEIWMSIIFYESLRKFMNIIEYEIPNETNLWECLAADKDVFVHKVEKN